MIFRSKRVLAALLALVMSLSMTICASALQAYIVDYDVLLALGENNLTLSADAVTTIYEFEPTEAGTYRFTASSPDAKIGYWGAGKFYVIDQTEEKSNVLECTVKNVGPSIMVGISGVESCVLTVEKIAEAVIEVEPEWEQYQNKTELTAFTMPNHCDMVPVNVTNSKINQAVMGSDGYYHLDAADGPLLIADLNHATLSLQAAMGYGQVRRYYYDDNGKLIRKLDFYNALEEYLAVADGTMYPVTEDIKTMLVELGDAKGWYVDQELGSYMFTGYTVDPNEAWMFVCYYLKPCQLIAVPEQSATYDTPGVKEHWICNVCKALYADSLGKTVVTESALQIPVLTGIEISEQPFSQTVTQGANAVFSVEAAGMGLTYRWQYSINGTSWYNCTSFEGRNTAQMTVPSTAARNGFRYRCVITDSYGKSVTTAAAVLAVDTPDTLKIVQQPENVTAANGSAVTFKVIADGDGLIYRWQYSQNGNAWYNSSFGGCNSATMNVPVTAARNGFRYRCVITDASGNKVTSASVILTVAEPATILAQPEDQTVAAGLTAVFQVCAEGENLTYYWQYSTNGTTWYRCKSFEGKDTTTLYVPATAARTGFLYRCVITDASGTIITSTAAELTVLK